MMIANYYSSAALFLMVYSHYLANKPAEKSHMEVNAYALERRRARNDRLTMNETATIEQASTLRGKVVDYLSLERNVSLASAAVFILGLGEELWKKFLPKYLEALGATTPVIGLFGTAQDFFDAVYQYPGGWIADRLGRRRAFLIFVSIASAGYVVYLLSPFWPFVFLALALAMAWQSMASPAIFAIIGDALPRERRAMGFTLQSILKRVPIVIAPIVGGALIAWLGVVKGVHVSLLITLVLGLVTMLLVSRINITVNALHTTSIVGVWQTFHTALKRLLISDVIIRTCEGMTGVITILYITNVQGFTIKQYGILVAIQMITSILVYIPAGKIADRVGRKPFVIATFLSFALFPLAIIAASSFAQDNVRARSVGLYYLVRSLSITPAALVGGLLWSIAPEVPFIVAGVIGLIGTFVFAATVEERYAS
jgi:MFS family permease